MKVISDRVIPDIKIIEPDIHRDARGYFLETYNASRYKEAGINAVFVQDNESLSSKGVVRGLHWQAAPYTQAKLVRVIRGAVLDVAVDIRKGSPTFGKYASCLLSAANGLQFFIPRGFAHGFIVMENDSLFSYKCDNLYMPEYERGMRFDDPALNIVWPKLDLELVLSPKDGKHPKFAEIQPWEEL